MIVSKIVIPNVKHVSDINEDERDLIKDEYVIVKDKDFPDFLYLFPKDYFLEEDYFYNVFELSKQIGKKFGKNTIYILLEENQEGNISYLVGNTHYLEKKYHSKGVLLRKKIRTEIEVLLKMIDFTLNIINPKKIVVFDLSKRDKDIGEIIRKIKERFEENYYVEILGKRELEKFLYQIKAYEEFRRFITPYIVAFIISLVIVFTSMFLAYQKQQEEKQKMEQIASELQKQIRVLKKDYANYEDILNEKIRELNELSNKKVYKGK